MCRQQRGGALTVHICAGQQVISLTGADEGDKRAALI